VFLTPIKPRQKVVTAEDIESSLYYLHVHGPEDERIIASIEDLKQETAEVPVSRLYPEYSSPHRKPLPAIPAVSASVSDGAQPRPLPPYPMYPQDWATITYRTPEPNLASSGVQRKPFAPPLPVRPDFPSRSNVDARGEHMPPKLLSAQSETQLRQEAHHAPTYGFRDESLPPPLPPRPGSASSSRGPETVTQLTLIRRDPASTAQWNVANITDPPVYEIASDQRRNSMTSSRIKKSGQPLYIEIDSPGYAKFTSRPDEPPLSPSSSTPSLAYASSASGSSHDDHIFRRRMWMEGSIFDGKPSGHRKATSTDLTNAPSGLRPSFDVDVRRSSDFSLHSTNTGLSRDPVMHSISTESDKKRARSRGYTLMSPWNGRCEFSAGLGSSLRCRHSLPKNGLSGDTSQPISVSELRFNLPGGGPLATPIPTAPATDSSGRRRSRFLHPSRHLRQSSSMDTTMNQSNLDLSLGQELAGGGFSGKQAKLGKLIIEDEGLKMLDLLVAANLGLWWRAYEKG
jgi:hypothetical protein